MPEHDRHEKTVRQFERLNTALKSGRLEPVRRIIDALSDSELADLLESLPPEPRLVVWNLIDPALDGEVLVHVADEVRVSLIEATDNVRRELHRPKVAETVLRFDRPWEGGLSGYVTVMRDE